MLTIASITDPGLVRSNNEDFYLYSGENRIIIVADGVGGHGYGEVASKIAAESCYLFLESELDFDDSEQGDEEPQRVLERAIKYANQRVLDAKVEKPAYKDMGTTLTCAWVNAGHLYYSYVGDSRIYLISARSKSMHLLTSDHTLSRELIDQDLAPGLHRNSNSILTRMVGAGVRVNPSSGYHAIEEGDYVLTCTDGLSDLVSNEAILETILGHPRKLDDCLQALLDMVIEKGARDNVSIILGHYRRD